MFPRAPTDPLTGLTAARFGLYIHFPYCLSKCPYCDFASTVVKQIPEQRYAQGLLRELELRLRLTPQLEGRPLESVYFGGGTPSLWAPRLVEDVLQGVREHLPLASDVEVTLEANPDASDARRFEAFRGIGINRLSIGVQSFQPRTLRALGRTHDGNAAERAFAAARAAGFDNLSLDFIYGIQGQSVRDAVADARRAVSLGPEHLSAYALTLDRESLAEDVPLAKQLARGEVSLPAEDEVLAMANGIRGVYAAHGYERYETSNYAQPELHSRHNALYWTGGEYLALGAGATGYLRPIRYSNHRSADRYFASVEAGELPEMSREHLGARELFEERLAMGLRLSNGIDLSGVCQAFGESLAARTTEVNRLTTAGFARWRGNRLALTDAGADIHSSICARLM